MATGNEDPYFDNIELLDKLIIEDARIKVKKLTDRVPVGYAIKVGAEYRKTGDLDRLYALLEKLEADISRGYNEILVQPNEGEDIADILETKFKQNQAIREI